MKFTYVTESDTEEKLVKLILEGPDKARMNHPVEERLEYLEKQDAGNTIKNLMLGKLLKEISSEVEDLGNRFDDDEELESIKKQQNVFAQIMVEFECFKQRAMDTEDKLRQALTKISALEQSLAYIRSDVTGINMSRKSMSDVINVHADQLDRLNMAVFDEEPEKKEA